MELRDTELLVRRASGTTFCRKCDLRPQRIKRSHFRILGSYALCGDKKTELFVLRKRMNYHGTRRNKGFWSWITPLNTKDGFLVGLVRFEYVFFFFFFFLWAKELYWIYLSCFVRLTPLNSDRVWSEFSGRNKNQILCSAVNL